MTGNFDRPARVAPSNAPVRARTAPPVTTTARSSDIAPAVGHFARLERFNLSQGFAELAEELTDRIAPIVRRQAGLRSFTLLTDETSGEYIFLTHWASLEQIEAFERSADEWRVRDIVSEHLTAVPQIEVYQVHNFAEAAHDHEVEPVAE